ncbi:uncharacterized protein LOC126304659 [Schistocerca gregaria]|uniref:uncharacterized protein LOC126304659 n=1 Tax=Schistocerca gregaria TaxID=7010 RepID=UPI00211E53E0|nr:uncharacterized protein LOC126304659 [Schistocerca gregaria]
MSKKHAMNTICTMPDPSTSTVNSLDHYSYSSGELECTSSSEDHDAYLAEDEEVYRISEPKNNCYHTKLKCLKTELNRLCIDECHLARKLACKTSFIKSCEQFLSSQETNLNEVKKYEQQLEAEYDVLRQMASSMKKNLHKKKTKLLLIEQKINKFIERFKEIASEEAFVASQIHNLRSKSSGLCEELCPSILLSTSHQLFLNLDKNLELTFHQYCYYNQFFSQKDFHVCVSIIKRLSDTVLSIGELMSSIAEIQVTFDNSILLKEFPSNENGRFLQNNLSPNVSYSANYDALPFNSQTQRNLWQDDLCNSQNGRNGSHSPFYNNSTNFSSPKGGPYEILKDFDFVATEAINRMGDLEKKILSLNQSDLFKRVNHMVRSMYEDKLKSNMNGLKPPYSMSGANHSGWVVPDFSSAKKKKEMYSNIAVFSQAHTTKKDHYSNCTNQPISSGTSKNFGRAPKQQQSLPDCQHRLAEYHHIAVPAYTPKDAGSSGSSPRESRRPESTSDDTSKNHEPKKQGNESTLEVPDKAGGQDQSGDQDQNDQQNSEKTQNLESPVSEQNLPPPSCLRQEDKSNTSAAPSLELVATGAIQTPTCPPHSVLRLNKPASMVLENNNTKIRNAVNTQTSVCKIKPKHLDIIHLACPRNGTVKVSEKDNTSKASLLELSTKRKFRKIVKRRRRWHTDFPFYLLILLVFTNFILFSLLIIDVYSPDETIYI